VQIYLGQEIKRNPARIEHFNMAAIHTHTISNPES
jgi:hypothetical protein